MNQVYFLAIDIGASSGRHIVGYRDEKGEIVSSEVYRFPNAYLPFENDLIWDLDYLFEEVKKGIKVALSKYPLIVSLGIDTWGVDYVLMKDNEPILPCYAYRSNRTTKVIDEVHKIISFERLYKITGTQFQPFNTIYQLYADKLSNRLTDATDFLMIPEYLMFKLTGQKVREYTNASTTGLLDLMTKGYSEEIVNCLNFPKNLFKSLSKPKTKVGRLLKEVEIEVGSNLDVVLVTTHDTASAVEGIPMNGNHPYISSGTWSLLGIKHPSGINSNSARLSNFTNEYGPGYIRLQKNIMGLWIIQCLAKELNLNFEQLRERARTSEYKVIFDVNDNAFLAPESMKGAILEHIKQNGYPLPKDDNDLLNACFYSLAASYKTALSELENLTNEKYEKFYIVGGGAKNDYLNELAQLMTEKQVIALPLEATSLGNLKIQMERYEDEKRND